ncbi:hypothetical protein G9A89_001767 [Geosiphon pyriformis]|nr:hypothetical protein G9A89_001767 [Geosiphon pyriformis]
MSLWKVTESEEKKTQQQLIAQMAYAPIAKLEKFSGKKDNAQTWINNITKAITTNN